MEVVALIGTFITAATKVAELAWHRMSERKKAKLELSEQKKKLAVAIVDEGRKIQSYLEFDKLITQIDRALEVILRGHERTEQDDVFWDSTEPTHRDLQDAVTVRLQHFDVSRFDQYHQGQVDTARPILQGQIQESQALFTTRHRKEYADKLHQAKDRVGQMRGFSSLIIEGVSKSLLDFGGSTDGIRPERP
jgi:hypothetical protein